MSDFLKTYFGNPCFENSSFEVLWENIQKRESFSTFSFPSEKEKSFNLPVAQHEGCESHYLPIEFLKGKQDSFVSSSLLENPHRVFLSSGTTSENRSRSYFSHDGLLLYKGASVKTFFDVLSHFFQREKVLKVKGISLIPKVSEWPDSSLAQMLEWFSQVWSVEYHDQDSFSKREASEPLWVFGTALQWKDLIDQGKKIKLPKGSVIVETGGLKSSKESFTREDLYQGIEDLFSVSQENIISEYGMCELASQAYDFFDKNLKMRAYRFPFWVKSFVLPPWGEFFSRGKGCLMIEDSLRVDYPFPVRTQDMADLSDNGSFQLLGRVPHSVLKGCSLLAEELVNSSKKQESLVGLGSKISQGEKALFLEERKREEVYQFLKDFFSSSKLRQELLKEYHSAKIVDFSVSDFLMGFPQGKSEMERALLKSKVKKGAHYLLVLPNNHAFVSFYPCLFALLGGARLSVRLPRAYLEGSVVHLFLKGVEKFFQVEISFLPPSARFPDGIKASLYDGVLLYGSDETYEKIKPFVSCPMTFFGSYLSASVIQDFKKETLVLMMKDTFSLGQKGCLSSRVSFFLGSSSFLRQKTKEIISQFSSVLNDSFVFEIPLDLSLALDHERVSFLRKKTALTYLFEKKKPLILFYEAEEGSSFEDFLSPCPFVLSIVFIKKDLFARDAYLGRSLGHLSTFEGFSLNNTRKTKDSFCHFVSLGTLNKTVWDGTHQGKSLFDFS